MHKRFNHGGIDMNETMNWLLKNLPQWPESKLNFMNVPIDNWMWVSDKAWVNGVYSETYYLINNLTGEFISDDAFYEERDKQRLMPCGISFKELIEDLNL